MGLFSKLFGSIDSIPEGGSAAQSGMLRTTREGGYDKRSVLAAIDALNEEAYELTLALAEKQEGKPYKLPRQGEPVSLEKVRAGGFAEEDVDSYIAKLQQNIDELRAQF